MEIHKALKDTPVGRIEFGLETGEPKYPGVYALIPTWAGRRNLIKFGMSTLLRRRVMSDYTVYWPATAGGFKILGFLRTARPLEREVDVLVDAHKFGFMKPPPLKNAPGQDKEWREYSGSAQNMRRDLMRLFDHVHKRARGDGYYYVFSENDYERGGRVERHTGFRNQIPDREIERDRPRVTTRAAQARGEEAGRARPRLLRASSRR